MPESPNSILKFQQYCTSPVFTILAGRNEIPFTVHSALLREKSPMFRAIIDGKWSESDARVIKWENWAPETVASFVQWIYTGEYECIRPHLHTKKLLESGEPEAAEKGKGRAEPEPPQPVSVPAPQSRPSNENNTSTVAISTPSPPDPNPDIWLSQNHALQTSASNLESELNSMKTNNEAAISAALEAFSRVSLSAVSSSSEPSETSKDHHTQFTELSALILAKLREQQKGMQGLRDRAEQLKKSVATAEMEARAARFASLFAQRKKAEQDRPDENIRSVHYKKTLEELKHKLEPTEFKAASNRSLPNNQLTGFESYINSLTPSRSNKAEFDSALLQHVRVYALAQYTETSDLEDYAFHALHVVLKAVEEWMPADNLNASLCLVALIEAVYELTPSGRLRVLVARVAAWRHRRLLLCLAYTDLLSSGGDFVVDLALNLGQRIKGW